MGIQAMYPRRKAGRCVSGAQRDQGRVFHMVPDQHSHTPAFCGTTPGRLSAGWVEDRSYWIRKVRKCKRCEKGPEWIGTDARDPGVTIGEKTQCE